MNKSLALASLILLASAAGQASSESYNAHTPSAFNPGVTYYCSGSARTCAGLDPELTGPLGSFGSMVSFPDTWTYTTAQFDPVEVLLRVPVPTSVVLFVSALVGLVTVGRNRKSSD